MARKKIIEILNIEVTFKAENGQKKVKMSEAEAVGLRERSPWELLPDKYSRIAGHFFTKLTVNDQVVTHSHGQHEVVESPRRCCPAPLHFSG
jgi:hypothetical protein